MTTSNHEGTNDRGRRLEALYEQCIKLPVDQQEDFIARNATDDPEMVRQLRAMVRLGNISAGNIFDDKTSSASRAAYHLPAGSEFGGCRILDPIGAGGMGAVYYALDLQNHERPVALKVLPPTLLNAASHERFTAETAALARLIHPNIARLYFRGIDNWNGVSLPFLVMEFVEGQTLDKFVDERPLSTGELLELLQKIARAVHYGHLKGVFHRDLKPANILVTTDGEPKLIDYGIALSGHTDANIISAPRAGKAGTIPYMAPEVAADADIDTDPRTDVYSLGVIVFEAFARRRPGVRLTSGEIRSLDLTADKGENTRSPDPTQTPSPSKSEILRNIATSERERLRNVSRRFPYDLECVIAKALRLDINARYTDAADFAEDLRRLIEFQPIKQLRTSRLYVAGKFVRRNRLAVAAGSVVLAAIIGSAVLFGTEEARANQLLTQKTEALERADLATRKAKERADLIQKQSADADFHAAEFAAQRGNWAAAVDEYRAAEQGGYADRLAITVGELRALQRQDRTSDAKALVHRVHQLMPDVANSPEYQLVEGFSYWNEKPDESLKQVKRALRSGEALNAGDRAFGEALTTDQIDAAGSKLRDTVRLDPFNRDAWALLGFCDLAQGDTRRCEMDEAFLQRLDPEAEVAAILSAVATGFQGRRSESLSYLKECIDLPAQIKSLLEDVVDTLSEIRTVDDFDPRLRSHAVGFMIRTMTAAAQFSSSRSVPTPYLFQRLDLSAVEMAVLSRVLAGKNAVMPFMAGWPNGDGDLAKGWLAFEAKDYAKAADCFHAAEVNPELIDCRRRACAMLILSQGLVSAAAGGFTQKDVSVIRSDLDRLASEGGINPQKFGQEVQDLYIGLSCQCYAQVRQLALQWFARQPDEPRAMYFIAAADIGLREQDSARWMLEHALVKGLTGDMKTDAEAKLRELKTDN